MQELQHYSLKYKIKYTLSNYHDIKYTPILIIR